MINSIDDERVVFYLRYEELIETWAAVRSDVVREANQFYFSLAEDLTESASELGDDVSVWVREGPWCNVGLYRNRWSGEDGPLMSYSYEWKADSTFSEGARTVGIWTNRGGAPGLQDIVANQVSDLRSSAGFPKSNRSWPAFRDAPKPSTDEYWTDLTDYREALVSGVVQAWEAFEERAHGAFETWSQLPR